MRTSPLDKLVAGLVEDASHLGAAERGAVLWLSLYALRRKRGMLPMSMETAALAQVSLAFLRTAILKMPKGLAYLTEDGAWLCLPAVSDVIARDTQMRAKKSRAALQRWSHSGHPPAEAGPRDDHDPQRSPRINGEGDSGIVDETDSESGQNLSGPTETTDPRPSPSAARSAVPAPANDQQMPYDRVLALATDIGSRPDAGTSSMDLRRFVTRLWAETYRDHHPTALLAALEAVARHTQLDGRADELIAYYAARQTWLPTMQTSDSREASLSRERGTHDVAGHNATNNVKSHRTVVEMPPRRERENVR